MAQQALTVIESGGETVARMIELVTDSVSSPSTKRNYARSLRDFLTWYRETGQQQFSKATVQRYAAELDEAGYSAANINQRLSAIRKLAREAADNGVMPEAIANGIKAVKGKRQEGRRTGNWLIKEQAEMLLSAPAKDTLKGLRDRAILGVFLGCGLRRQELAGLTFDHIRQRDARWVIVDLVGKRGKVRTVPMPSWTKVLIDRWAKAAGISTGRIFRPVNKGGHLSGDEMTAQAIYKTLSEYVQACDLGDVAPHDLRRTFAKLAHKGGAPIEQIQLSLGHASVQTTERYLGVEQNLTDAPCDHLGLKVEL
jgi:site-specific recombinase XerD